MAKFTFQFETVLQMRQKAEDECQRYFAKQLRQRMILHQELRNMQQSITQSKQNLRGGLIGEVDMARVGDFARFSGQVTQRAQSIVVKLAGVEKQIEAARVQLLEATKARKVMEMLREKRLNEWRRRQELVEAAELDEINNQKHARRIMGARP